MVTLSSRQLHQDFTALTDILGKCPVAPFFQGIDTGKQAGEKPVSFRPTSSHLVSRWAVPVVPVCPALSSWGDLSQPHIHPVSVPFLPKSSHPPEHGGLTQQDAKRRVNGFMVGVSHAGWQGASVSECAFYSGVPLTCPTPKRCSPIGVEPRRY